MGTDYQQPAADIDYRQDNKADSTAEEQLEAFIVHDSGLPGPIDVVWSDRQDLP